MCTGDFRKSPLTWVCRFAIALFIILAGLGQFILAQTEPPTPTVRQQEPGDPALTHRPPPQTKSSLTPEGKIKLDVVVNDASGKPVLQLEP